MKIQIVPPGSAGVIICNAFSLQMLDSEPGAENRLTVSELDGPEGAREFIADHAEGFVASAIGHADTARIVSGLLGIDLPANRVEVRFYGEDRYILVAQYSGPRLPEGATALPDGATIRFYAVSCRGVRRRAVDLSTLVYD